MPRGLAGRACVLQPARWLFFPAGLWVALWFSINTGPWVLLEGPKSGLEWLHAVRAFFPQLVLLLACAYVSVSGGAKAFAALPASIKLWLFFGLVGLLACSMSPSPLRAAYWSLAYLGAIAGVAAYLGSGDRLEKAVQLNYLSWVLTTVFLLTMVFFAREALFADPNSGYSVIGRKPEIMDMPMSRATGLARFAAVPAIVGLGYALCRRGAVRMLGGLLFTVSFAAFIYYLQARGSIVGFAGAAIVVMLLAGVRGKAFLAGLALAAICCWAAQAVPEGVWSHVTRGDTTWAQLSTFSGRVNTWQQGWEVFVNSPVIGQGPQAGRMVGVGEIHNTWLSALLQSGTVGALALLVGLLLAWKDAYTVARRRIARDLGQQILLAQAGGILAFFTLRGMVEQCGSLFNVDLLVMLPAMAYVGLLAAKARNGRSPVVRRRHGRMAG